MCQYVCVVFVVLLVASVLASMRWLLCGGDRSKKETKSLMPEAVDPGRERNLYCERLTKMPPVAVPFVRFCDEAGCKG